MVLRVAVIGAGAAGLSAARHLAAKPEFFGVTVFEQANQVGGTWVYTEQTGFDEWGLPIHSSMYKTLRTNLPKDVMAFPDFAFPRDGPSFISHSEVCLYLQDYCDNFHLTNLIQFQTRVDTVSPRTEDERQLWDVTVQDITSKQMTQYEFDAVMVCVGHYSTPQYPNIVGLEQFDGQVVHSHDYKTPEAFRDQRVVVLGAGSSGQDIALEVSSVATEVTLSHNKPRLVTPLPNNVQQNQGITRADEEGFLFDDGEYWETDAIILCTGYLYTFPFLSSDCHVTVTDSHVTPLYKHLIHTEFPSLCFIGLTSQVLPFPQFDFQVRFFLSTLYGTTNLPSREEMDADTQADLAWRLEQGMPSRHAHKMGPLQWQYNLEIHERHGVELLPPVYEKLFSDVRQRRLRDFITFREDNYSIVDSENYVKT